MAHARGGRRLGQFVKGDVVVVNFPFSDLSHAEKRPALVLAVLPGVDVILCQITSQTRMDASSIRLETTDFTSGGLNQRSFIRPNQLFTADSTTVLYRAGAINRAKIDQVIEQLVSLLKQH